MRWNSVFERQDVDELLSPGTEVKVTGYDMLMMIKQSLGTLKEQTHEKYDLTDKDLESVIGETNAVGEWLPLKSDKENKVPAALRLNPDEVDRRDTDLNDYRVYEGHHYRVSAKDEAAFKELRLLKLAGTKRNGKRRNFRSYSDEMVGSEGGMVRGKENKSAYDEKRKLAAQAKKDALWTANGECPKKTSIHQRSSNAIKDILVKSSRTESDGSVVYGKVATAKDIHSDVPELIDLTTCDDPCSAAAINSIGMVLPHVNPSIVVLGETKSGRNINKNKKLAGSNRDFSKSKDSCRIKVASSSKNEVRVDPEIITLD
ncbi:hypothetical protein RB195_007553 [Necator americanus]|uniref:Uncharacterized protein n=1 Tax=Necator americanus TaxID=51031 RepID=A0ABR1C1L3_NECAM